MTKSPGGTNGDALALIDELRKRGIQTFKGAGIEVSFWPNMDLQGHTPPNYEAEQRLADKDAVKKTISDDEVDLFYST